MSVGEGKGKTELMKAIATVNKSLSNGGKAPDAISLPIALEAFIIEPRPRISLNMTRC